MNKNESSDAFAHYVIGRINPDIRKSLTEEQFNEIRSAIIAAFQGKIRVVVPLFFIRYYFVFLMGRDRRSKTKFLEFNRRSEGHTITSQIFLFIILVPLILILFLVIYLAKSESGIDFFIDYHVIDLFNK